MSNSPLGGGNIMDWFRYHHGTQQDAKLSMIAKQIGVKRCEMTAIWDELMDFASRNVTRGHVMSIDLEVIAFAQDVEIEKVKKIYRALEEKGIIINGVLTAWEKRQPKREDEGSAQRQREKRARDKEKKEAKKPRKITLSHDASRNVTTDKIRVDKIRIDKEENIKKEIFENFWIEYGKIGSKEPARKVFMKIDTEYKTIIDGLRRYQAHCKANVTWYKPQHASTWLNNRGWEDEHDNKAGVQAAPLTDHEKLMQRLGTANWKRITSNMTPDPGELRVLEEYEVKNGKVWWNNLSQWKEKMT